MQNAIESKCKPLEIMIRCQKPKYYAKEEDLPLENRQLFKLLKIDNVPSAVTSRLLVSDNVTLSKCSNELIETLEIKLNPPAIGSMRNWEHLASVFGLQNDLIVSMRHKKSPIKEFFRRCSDKKFNELVSEIAKMERIDVLLSLRKIKIELQQNQPQSLQLLPTDTISSMSSATYNSNDYGNFILVLHYEEDRNDRKNFKWFLDNLRKCEQDKFKIYDANEEVDKNNLYSSAKKLFITAKRIVVTYNDDLCNAIKQDPLTNIEKYKKILHTRAIMELMDQEYNTNYYKNTRFVGIVMKNCNRELLPVGWIRNTLVYEFPLTYADFCEAAFK